MSHHYTDQRIALLTQHGKEQVIAPVLEPALSCKIELVSGFDTDTLGTFTRETPRAGTQLEAARRKARIGMELSGLPIGLASEGSFGLDPMTGLFPWNLELLVLLDDRAGIELVAMSQGPASSGHLHTDSWADVEAFAQREGFPAQQLVLRPNDQADPGLVKGIADWQVLRQCFEDCRFRSRNGKVFLETDLRAFANPNRMQRIGEAAVDLLKRLQSPCPACGLPGFWIAAREPGLPCATCRTPTAVYQKEIWACPACQHKAATLRQDRLFADPGECPRCNP
ncbi:DUF6671 family protein [Chitinimonas sp. BJYL2]|uniref:DUF6671 family protein n=1 Tax=Chitinimonas sp. BJYL2 TaxID=2976696 RepID=UPI0022B569B9|nr:DUF6671 family protein [Chitinimonas sp. BJYL2]